METFLSTYWFEILLFVVAGTPSIVLFAIKGRISHWFAKDLKKYEQRLDMLKMQKQLQYHNIYVERATIIKDLYILLAKLIEAKHLVKEFKYQDKAQERATYAEYGELLRQLYVYFMTNAIYLPQSVVDKLGAFASVITKDISLKQLEHGDVTDEYIKRVKDIPDYDLPEIHKALRMEFQSLLGITEK